MGKLTINGPFSIAMLVYQRVKPSGLHFLGWIIMDHEKLALKAPAGTNPVKQRDEASKKAHWHAQKAF